MHTLNQKAVTNSSTGALYALLNRDDLDPDLRDRIEAEIDARRYPCDRN